MPEKEKSSLRAMPFSKIIRCSLRPTLEHDHVQVMHNLRVYFGQRAGKKNHACFWLLPSERLYVFGAISFSAWRQGRRL